MFDFRLGGWLKNTGHWCFDPEDEFTYLRVIRIDGQQKEVTFRVVEDSARRLSASQLLNDRYGWRGYGSSHCIPSDVQHRTFTAELDGTVVGTVTLAIDSEHRLAVDHTFGEELSQIRLEPGTRVCELIRLAFQANLRSKEILAGLFHLAFIYGTMFSECTDLLIEVAPRHTAFYKATLGFEAHGSLKQNLSVEAASQLMRLKVDYIRRNILELAGHDNAGLAHSLYPHFFSPFDDLQIRAAFASRQERHGGAREAFSMTARAPLTAAEGPTLEITSEPLVQILPEAARASETILEEGLARAA